MMDENKLKGLLTLGEDIIKYQDIEIKNYSLREIFSKDFGLDKYYYLTWFLNIDKTIITDKYKFDVENKSLYECIWEIPELVYWFLEVLNAFTNYKWAIGDWKDYITYDENNKRHRFYESKFDEFVKLLKKIYCVNGKDIESTMDLNPDLATSEEARKMTEEFAEFNNQNKKNKGNITMNGIITGVCSKGIGYNFFNIWDLKMYQLMSVYYSIEQNEKYGYIMTSVYHGVWDTKKNPIDSNKIHWAIERLPD